MHKTQHGISNTNKGGDIGHYIKLFGRNKLLTLLIISLFMLGGLVYSYFSQPVYETYSTMEVGGDKVDIDIMNRNNYDKDSTLIDTEVEIIRSRKLVEQALDKVGYQNRYFIESNYKKNELYKNSPIEISDIKVKNSEFYGTWFHVEALDDEHFRIYTAEGGIVDTLKKNIFGKDPMSLSYDGEHIFGEKIDTPYFSAVINKKSDVYGKKLIFVVSDKNSAISNISRNLSVFPVAKNGSIIKMIYQDNVSKRAKDFLDALVDTYMSKSVNKNTTEASQALNFIDTQLKEVKAKLKKSALKLENYKEENNLMNIDSESDVTIKQLSKYKAELSDIKIQENAFQSLYEEFKKGNYGAVSSLAREYPVLETLLSDFQRAKSEKITLLGSFTESHPDVEKSNEKIEDVKMALESSIESINDALREKKRSIEDTLYSKETTLLKLPEKERQLADLKRTYEVNQKTYQFLLEKQSEMQINKASNVSGNRVLDRAIVTKKPVKPNKAMIMGASTLLGLLAALLFVLAKDFFDDKIKTRDDLSAITKVPFYGVVPHVKSAEKMFILDDQQSVASEAMRLIRTNLEFIPTENKSKVIVVSSTVPGEGKTTTATNLASVFGMGEKRCIVISLDMRRPMLHRVFALTNKVGMSTVLSKNSELKEVIWEHKKIKNLDIITSGPIPPNPSELMQSGKLNEIIDTLRDSYDYIIIDAPPMGALTDSILLMKLADISLVVFRSEFSEKEYVKSLEEMATSYDINNVGLILNDVKPKNLSQSFFKYSYTYK
jgi:capsular exopolysaccharide synthesis family protein